MPSFEELGLREELVRTLEDEDFTRPTALQAAVIPALRRGGNLVARASAGSGKTLAYALGVFDRLQTPDAGEEEEERGDGEGPRVLVLVPAAEEAERIAAALIPYAHAVGLSVTVPGAGWRTGAGDASVLVAHVRGVAAEVDAAALKLDAVEAVVVDGASAVAELGDWDAVDALLDLVPRDAQRIVLSASLPEIVSDLIDRRVKRALRYPAEAAVDRGEAPEAEGVVGYVLATEREKLELLAAQLGGRESGAAPPVIFCRSDERAAELAERLALRGFVVGEPDEEDVDVAIAAADGGPADGAQGQSISYDVPGDAESLRARHLADADAVVLVEPRELAHLREIARQARLKARPTPMQIDTGASAAALRTFREEIRTAIREEDLTAQMLVLEPLFDEFTAAEVAAAAAALLRRRRPADAVRPSAPADAAPPPRAPAEKPGAAAGSPPATWARLFVGVGTKEEIRPGDLVGALAGEANIPGSKIGKIEIRDSFSIVEVQADVADQVIRAVNGTTMKGRSVRVDYDRGGPARRPQQGGRGGPTGRRTTRRPPAGGAP